MHVCFSRSARAGLGLLTVVATSGILLVAEGCGGQSTGGVGKPAAAPQSRRYREMENFMKTEEAKSSTAK